MSANPKPPITFNITTIMNKVHCERVALCITLYLLYQNGFTAPHKNRF